MRYILLMAFAGCLIAMQSPINAALSRHTGGLEASLVSFLTGTLFLTAAAFFFGDGHILKAFQAPAWQWSGGLLGAILVFVSIVCVPKIGALNTGVAMILGSLFMATLLDNFGCFGLPVIRVSLSRIFGLCLILAGLYFVFKR
ncbi:MAG: DMT family transporter [Desulfovibrio sp.]|nr:DMT family transporter [Desulfovibrio sp.]